MKPKILAALLAALALSAIAASTATAALPEFKTSSGVFGEKLKDTVSSSERFFAANPAVDASCLKTSITGELKNSKELGNVIVTFSGQCETPGLFGSCENITSKSLKGHIAYLNKSKKEVGLELEGEGGGEEPVWAEFKCGGTFNIVLKGHLIGTITNLVNNPGESELKLNWESRTEGKGVQIPSSFEGGLTGQQLRWNDPYEEKVLWGVQPAGTQELQFASGTFELKA